ncbi:MAG: acetyl-CoA carboxylase biotin carboxyl carrier protein [Thermoguttaceae bacterium]
MGNTEKEKTDLFDVRRIRQLLGLMQDHDVLEIDLQQGDQRVQLRRGSTSVATPIAVLPSTATVVNPVSASTTAPIAVAELDDPKHFAFVKSPMVGTFYSSSSPGAPSFAKIGDFVSPEKTVCIIEAMKVFNEIQAELTGKIVAVLVKNGEPVEFGKPLFKIDLRG